MTLSNDDLLAFDRERLGMIEGAPRALLDKHEDVYRAQLVAARWLDRYRERRTSQPQYAANPHFEAGIQGTLTDIVANLRRGDFLPGGRIYEDEMKRLAADEQSSPDERR
jgi:hypothetical protein